MAITQISRIQHRRGLRIDLPNPLNDAEFGWCEDTRELFIGNGPFFGGNTQIITEFTPANVQKYTYIGNTGTSAVTGFDPSGDPFVPNGDFKTERSYQQKFDDMVDVRDYGAVGDGVVDDAPAITRALIDLYDETSSPQSSKKYRKLFIPAGTYRLSRYLPIYPLANIVGEDKASTVLFLDTTLALSSNDCVARTVDSQGNIQSNIGSGGAIYKPQDISIINVTFKSNAPQTNADGLKELVKLEKATRVRFVNCDFVGTWQNGDTTISGSRAIYYNNFGDNTIDSKSFSFNACGFYNVAYISNVDQNISDVYIVNSIIKNVGYGLYLQTIVGSNQPRLFRISHSYFDELDFSGFANFSTGAGNISSYNYYGSIANDPAVLFDVVSNYSVSIGDTFLNDTAWSCSTKATNPRVRNLGTNNIVMNVQDQLQIPQGFCGDLIVDGNFTVNGNLIVNGAITAPSTPVTPVLTPTPNTYDVTYIPYTSGNVVFFEYGLRVGGPGFGVYRIGLLKIVHDGQADPLVQPVNLDYTDNYVEMSGPPGSPITLSAIMDNTNNRVAIQLVTVGPVPVINFNIRSITL